MADDIITAFPPYYDEVPMSRGAAGWENPPYYLTAYGLAVKHGYTGTEEEWLASLKGDPGPGIVILGHYDTLAALEEAVTEPEDGDMYDVGSGASQLVYYWSDAQEDWLPLNVHGPQGETGPAGADGAPGVDGADGASAYEQAQEAGYSGTEQEFMSLLADLPGYTEQARLWAVAAGEAETAAEGYAEAAAASAASIDVTNYVPKTRTVNGKALSSDISLDKTDIGLSNVDNVLQYSASNKPSAADVTYSGTVGGVVVSDVKSALDYVPSGSNSVPSADSGGGLAGVSNSWSRSDHIHPSDTSRVPITRKINNTQLNADLALYWGSTITLTTSWSGSGPYTQTVSVDLEPSWVDGITSNSLISLQPTAAQIAQLITDGVTALLIENNNGTLTAYALGAAPSTAMTIACTVTEVVSA